MLQAPGPPTQVTDDWLEPCTWFIGHRRLSQSDSTSRAFLTHELSCSFPQWQEQPCVPKGWRSGDRGEERQREEGKERITYRGGKSGAMRPTLRDSREMQLETFILGSQAPAFQEVWLYFLPCWSVEFSLSNWLKWFSVLTTKQLEQNPKYVRNIFLAFLARLTEAWAVFHINHKTATEAHKPLSFSLKPHTELKFTAVLKSLPYYRHRTCALISPPSTGPVKAEHSVFQMHEDPQ